MQLVIDSNELFAGIITKGKKLQSWTLDILFSNKVRLFAPFRLLAELDREEIKAKSGFSERDFNVFVEILKLRIEFVPLEIFLDKLTEAKELAPHLKDIEFFALALKFNLGIWSEEESFKNQSEVKVYNTKELIELLKLK